MFIVLYGINNLGKTLQAKLLVEKLNQSGIQAEYLKYPIYDLKPSGQILNAYLRSDNPHNLSACESQIIYALNRTQFEPILKEKLASGITIVAEDYTGTGLAWGIGAGVNEQFLKDLNSHLIKEDLALLFDGERFLTGQEINHKHEKDETLIQKVRQTFLRLAQEFNWKKINANQSIEMVAKEVWDKLEIKN